MLIGHDDCPTDKSSGERLLTPYPPRVSLAYAFSQEVEEGKLFVDAAKAANVKLLIWSGLPHVNKLSGGKYLNVRTFDAKAEVTQYAKDSGVPFVNVQCGAFMLNYGRPNRGPKKQLDGSFVIQSPAAPDTLLPLIDTEADYGLFVRKAIETPVESGTEIFAYSEVLTCKEIMDRLSKGDMPLFLPR